VPSINSPFSPGATASLAVTTTSSSVGVTAANSILRVVNLGPNKAYVRWGVGAQTALVADMCIPVGVETFTKAITADTFAAICDAAESALLKITSGEGT
jgi:hypothetical protein